MREASRRNNVPETTWSTESGSLLSRDIMRWYNPAAAGPKVPKGILGVRSATPPALDGYDANLHHPTHPGR